MTAPRLLYSCDSNWLYATGGIHASDPVLWYSDAHGETHIAVPDLDMAKYRQEQAQGRAAQHLHLYSALREEILAAGKIFSVAEMALALVSRDGGVAKGDVAVEVPADFPLALADKLRAGGIKLTPPENGATPFFSGRYIKTLAETEHLAAAQRLNEQALHHAVSVLRQAEIAKNHTLFWHGQVLTAETLRAELNKKALELGATEFAGGPIIGCAVQGAMPHERGSGPLRAHELIVIDTFPRSPTSYWGDLTRTFVKGQPTSWQRRLYDTVLAAQTNALAALRAGANGKEIDAEVTRFFAAEGFPNVTDAEGNPCGYIHSLGHSIGLDLHDTGAGLSRAGQTLVAGSVLTVEPGLYYPTNVNGGVGGVRIEDVVAITESGHTNLTTFPKDKWVLD